MQRFTVLQRLTLLVLIAPALVLSVLFVIFVTMGPSGAAHAQDTSTGVVLEAYDYEAITVSTVAIGFTAAKIAPANQPSAKLVFCTLESQPIRYRYDGTAPTSTEGHAAIAAEKIPIVNINNIRRFRAIRSGGSDGTLRCTFLR